jgi:hypothetical protein
MEPLFKTREDGKVLETFSLHPLAQGALEGALARKVAWS